MTESSFLSEMVVYHGIRFDVHRVALAGAADRSVQREMCVMPDAVVILPRLDSDRVVLIRNRRFAVRQTLWELPAGTVETGEEPLSCAERELTEETGYRAIRFSHLMDFYPSPGATTELMHAYLADDLVQVGQNLDENERIEVEVVPLLRSMQMIRDNTIRDGKTIATLLYYHSLYGNQDA